MLNILKEEIKMSEIYKNLDLNDIPNEEWLPIEGYEELYEVSNMGRVKSLNYNNTNKEKIKKQVKFKNGYLYVSLNKKKKIKTIRVHRLVANAFIPNPNCYPMLNHKDECKTNNCVDNLEWCDAKYNANYGTAIQRSKDTRYYNSIFGKIKNEVYNNISKKKSKQVYQYSKDGVLIAIWESTSECGKNGFHQSHISACCRNCFNREGNNVYKGYIWSYTPIDFK